MKINRLKVRGSVGIFKGLGLEEIDLDLSKLSGLIAIAGNNGVGKSSLLEMLHPYACMVSRKGALARHFFLKDSFKELGFEFKGDHYRSLIKIDSESARTEGYLWKNHEEKSMTDGKISVYNKKIVELIGSQELFFNSAFCAQNAKSLNDLTTGKLKELFSEFLGHDRLIAFEGTAKKCSNKLALALNGIDIEIASIQEYISGYGDPAGAVVISSAAKTEYEKKMVALNASLERAEVDIEKHKEAAHKKELLDTELSHLQISAKQLGLDIEDCKSQESAEVNTLRKKYNNLAAEKASANLLLTNEPEIKKAVKVVEECHAAIDREEVRLDAIRQSLVVITRERVVADNGLADETSSYRAVKSAGENSVKMLTNGVESLKITKSDLNKRDPDCSSTTCSFIVRALGAIPKITELETEIKNFRSLNKRTKDVYSGIQNEKKAVIDALRESEKAALSEKELISRNIAILKDSLVPAKQLAADIDKVSGALLKKELAEKQEYEIEIEGKRVKQAWQDTIKKKVAAKDAAVVAMKAAAKKVSDIIGAGDETAVDEIRPIKEAIVEVTGFIATAAAAINTAKKESAMKESATKELAEKKGNRVDTAAELSDWSYLKNACGANMLRALEIDNVCPIISSCANELLSSTFGSAFTVKIRTQNEETGHEVLDIIVIDENGSEILLNNLSGGQKVYILKALRLAMPLIAKTKGNMAIDTAFADEEDGSLDSERAQHFIGLYRSFMASGGFQDCYYISHKQECVAMADHVLTFEKGGISIS